MTAPRKPQKNRANPSRAEAATVSSAGARGLRTDGQRRLDELSESGAELARRLGVARSTVACWRRGTKLPSPAMRRALETETGIPVAAWTARPDADGQVSTVDTSPLMSGGHRPSTLAEAEGLLEGLQTALGQPGLTAGETARLSTAAASLLTTIEKLQAIGDQSAETIRERLRDVAAPLGRELAESLCDTCQAKAETVLAEVMEGAA